MADELTPWEEINPPMASAQRRVPASPSLDGDARIVFRNELTACLALAAPVGMTEENRRDWLAVAWDTLKHLPPSILRSGALVARQKCDHPAKIVPTIIAETQELMRWHHEGQRHASEAKQIAPPIEDVCTPEQMREIMAEFGLKRNPLGERET